MQQTTISKPPRVEVVDSLRGFATWIRCLGHLIGASCGTFYLSGLSGPGYASVMAERIE